MNLIAPFESDPEKWLDCDFTDIHSGERYAITTGLAMAPGIIAVKSFGDVVAEFRRHPEAKSAAPDGAACTENTTGLLQRRHVIVADLQFTGKESNRLEEWEAGLVYSQDDVQTTYSVDQPLFPEILLALKSIPADELAAVAGISARQVKKIRNGHAHPSPATKRALMRAARQRIQTD